MKATAIILTADNEATLTARADEFDRGLSVLFTEPGVGIYGRLRRFPFLKQDSGTHNERCADAIGKLLDVFPDAQEFLIENGMRDPISVSRSGAVKLAAEYRRKAIEETTVVADRSEPDIFPAGCEQADFVTLTTVHSTPGWWETKGWFVVGKLVSVGITAAAARIRHRSAKVVSEIIERLNPKVIVSRAMIIDTPALCDLARKYPQIQFVNVCHSSIGDLGRSRHALRQVAESTEAAQSIDNFHFGFLDERLPLAELAANPKKQIWLPNVVKEPAFNPEHQVGSPVRVSLICAPRDLKNLSTQLLGAAIAGRQRPLRLYVSLLGERPAWFGPFVASLGLDAEFVPWRDWRGYTDWVSGSIDVGMQVSYTESFNFVAVEHLLMGKPVVGSTAIRYLPDEWKMNPDDAKAIARVLIGHIDNWTERSATAREHGLQVADHCNETFLSTVRRLIDDD